MRPRKHNRHLPARMYQRRGRFFYADPAGKWHPLSKDYGEALAEYGRHVSATGHGMPALIDRFLVEVATRKAPATRKEYDRIGARLKDILAEFAPRQIKPHHIARVIDHEAHERGAPVQANRMRALLSSIFAYGVRIGAVEANPCRDVKGISVAKRDRYLSDDELTAIKAKAPASVGVVIDLCYLTAQRISDVLKIRRADISAEGVYFQQGKTGKKLLVSMSPDLAAAIERAKALHKKNVRGLTLLHGRGGKPLSYFGVSAMFRRACKAAGVADCHLHDIRAKAITDARRQGLDAQRLAGHATSAMTDHYVKARQIETAHGPVKGKF